MGFIKLIFLIQVICLPANFLYAQEEPVFSAEQLRADFDHLRHHLQTKHPGLYLYTTKTETDRLFDSLYNSIGPATAQEFYKHISIISSVLKDGHTIILPGNKWLDYHNANSRFLPYKFCIINNRLYVDLVCTADGAIACGDEILSINNITAAKIIDILANRQVRDGYNLTYPYWILNNYFKAYYSFIYGHPTRFEIQYKQGGIIKTALVQALTNDSIAYFRKLKYPGRSNDKKTGEGITLVFSPDNQYAVLTIRDFHNDVLKKEYRQNFTSVIRDYFKQLQEKNPGHLIIDIRNNQGGDITNGAELLSYLLNKPFSVVDAYYEVDNAIDGYQLKKTSGQSLGIHQPKQNVYSGKLLVLINGGSFSNSGIVASCLKVNNRAVFIGEETGGNNKLIAGYTKDIVLPNSGIQVQVPTRQFMLYQDMPLTGRGTMPDITVQPTVKGFIDNTDLVMQAAIVHILQDK